MSARLDPGPNPAAVDGRSSSALPRELRDAAVSALTVVPVAARSVNIFK